MTLKLQSDIINENFEYLDENKQDKLVAGAGISITNNVISSTASGVEWGNITGALSSQADLQTALDGKQPTGDYVTNTELEQGLATKQDTISDLGTIRNGAELGATALQEVPSEYITETELSAYHDSTKQDVITDLDDIRSNISTNTSNISYLDEKVRDIELFKFPNAVIIGEPSISNGQVSGFSANNYMQFPFVLDLHNTPFQIDFAFTTGDNVTTQQNILDSEFGLALAVANGKGLMAISGNGTSWNIGSSIGTIAIQPNTTYYARLSWDGMQYKTLISTNGTDYTQDMYLVGTQRPYPRTIFIGGCSGSAIGHTPHPFLGSINMNKAYLSTKGQVIWQGMDDAGLSTRADLSLSNLDELGEKRFTDLQTEINTKANNSDLTTHTSNGTIHVTASDKIAWSNKVNQDQLSGYGSELDYADETLSLLNTSGEVLSSVNIKSTPDLDNKSINLNSSEQLQAIGIIDSNGNAMKTWRGTLAEYNALDTKDDNTLYKITDDTDTGTDILQMIYPVGSLYLTTNATCPLANLFGTWSLVSQDRVLQGAGSRGAVGTTINESLPNIKAEMEFSYGAKSSGPHSVSGAMYAATTGTGRPNSYDSNVAASQVIFDASRSSSTYQDGSPVQQNAYLINVFRRIL